MKFWICSVISTLAILVNMFPATPLHVVVKQVDRGKLITVIIERLLTGQFMSEKLF